MGGSARRTGESRLVTVALACFTLVFVGLPMWVLLVNSAKTTGAAKVLNLALPTEWRGVENYSRAFVEGDYVQGLKNTLIIVTTAIVVNIAIAVMAAWTFARTRRRSVRFVYYLAILPIMLPAALIPTIFVLRAVGLLGTQFGLILFYATLFLGLSIFLLTGFIKSVPVEIEEAALIDGAGPMTIVFRIILPLLAPVMAALALILFIILWNEFFWPTFLIRRPADQPLTVGLFNFISSQPYDIRWELVFAHVVLISAPVIAIFVIGQRRLVSGITSGAVK